MTREFSAWATSSRRRRRPGVTWPQDMARFLTTGFGLRRARPATAPPPALRGPSRLSLQEFRRSPAVIDVFAQRLDYQVAGLYALEGLDAPVIFAANEQGVLDWPVLRSILPSRLRTQRHSHTRALVKGRSVAVFSENSIVEGGVGEFSTQAAELANQYNIPIVPVAILGTFKLKEILRLSLRTKPQVAIRFGAPIYVRGRSIFEATDELQIAVSELFNRGDISWWAGQKRLVKGGLVPKKQPRWRRLWDQSAPRPAPRREIWQ